MKPQRIKITNNLIENYGLYKKMEVYVSFLFIITFYIKNIIPLCYNSYFFLIKY